MNNHNDISYFDGHNDTLLQLYYSENKIKINDFIEGNLKNHIDLPRIKLSNFIGGFFAIFSPNEKPTNEFFSRMKRSTYDFKLPDPLPYSEALAITISMISILNDIQKKLSNEITVCKNSKEIQFSVNNNILAIVLHIEGAEAISENFDSLDILYSLGVRSIGPVWSRPNIFGHGVPFSFPKTPDTGPGLTNLGKELVKKCNDLNIIIDLSHLNEKGFWDVANISKSPLVATHSNAHQICPHSRNLTDKQLEAIKATDGIVGINLATAFLRTDGIMDEDTDLEYILRHFDHLINILGEDRVAIGSDFDGAKVPLKIKDIQGMNTLKDFFTTKGYDKNLVKKLFSQNWLNFLYKYF